MKKCICILMAMSVLLSCGCKKKKTWDFEDDQTINNIEDFEDYLESELKADKKNNANYTQEDFQKGFYSTSFIIDALTSNNAFTFFILNRAPEDQLSDYINYVKIESETKNMSQTEPGSQRIRDSYDVLTASYSVFEVKENAVEYFKKRCQRIETSMRSSCDQLEFLYEFANSNYRPWYAELYQIYSTDATPLTDLDESLYYFDEDDAKGYICFNIDISAFSIPDDAQNNPDALITRQLYNVSVTMKLRENTVITACSYQLVNSSRDSSRDFVKNPIPDDQRFSDLCRELGLADPVDIEIDKDLQIQFGGFVNVPCEPASVIKTKKKRLAPPDEI